MNKKINAWKFLAVVIILYAIAGIFSPEAIMPSMEFSFNLLIKIIPVFAIIFVLMVGFEYFVSEEKIKKYLSASSGKKRWIIAIGAGILSSGPIYAWYPMLGALKKKGVGFGLIATFIYSRAIKLQLLPIMAYFFGIKYTIVLTVVLIFMSIVQGMIFENVLNQQEKY